MGSDLRFAWRLLCKRRGITAAAILMLALGIGANTAVFSILQGTLLRPLPYRDPDRLVDVLDESRRESRLSKLFATYADYREYARHARSFDQVGGATWAVGQGVLTGRGPARPVVAIPVTDGFFSVLGVQPAMGRGFTPEDAAGGCAIVLAHAFWVEWFGADRAVVGRSVALDQRECRVLGVMPAGFEFYPVAAQFWRVVTPDLAPRLDELPLFIVGRLRPGVTREQAQEELRALHTGLHTSDRERQLRPAVDELHGEFTWLAGRNLRSTLWLLLAAVGLVLLIACLNVANLLLGRAVERGPELAVRVALGSGRARLARQLLTETLVLAAIGGGLGVLLAEEALRYFRAVNPVEMPVGARLGLSVPALLFTAAASLLTAVLSGLAPAWKLSRVDLNEALKRSGRGGVTGGGRSRMAHLLVAAEMALSVALLAGAGLLMRSVLRMGAEPLGFEPGGLYSARLMLPADRYRSPSDRIRFYEQMEAAAAAQPGIREAATSTSMPPFFGGNYALQIEGRLFSADTAVHDVAQTWASPSWFHAVGIGLRSGRVFDAHDRAGSVPVAVVDEALAREYFHGGDPIGQRIRIASDAEDGPWLTIVGVVAGVKRTTVFQEMGWSESPSVYRPLAQQPPDGGVSIAVRTDGGAVPVEAELRRAGAAVDPEAAVGGAEAVKRSMARLLAYPRFRAVVFGAFAFFALLLAAVGLHGVLSQVVAQRTREIGLRMALGARQADIARLIALQGGAPVMAGLALGVAAALAMGRWVAALLYGVRAGDPLTLAGVSMILAGAAGLAIAVPARRAARTDPQAALRQE